MADHPTYEEAVREVLASSPSNIRVEELLEIAHPSFGDPIRIVRNRIDPITVTLEDGSKATFLPVAFDLQLPKSGDSGFQDLTLTFDNVDRFVSDHLAKVEGSDVPVSVTYRLYRSDDLITPQLVPPLVLSLTDAQVNLTTVSGKATFVDLKNKKFPNDFYTRARFPSLGDS